MSDVTAAIEARIPASLQRAIDEKLALATEARVAERVRAEDATLWAPEGTPEVANRLGWLTIAERTLSSAAQLKAFAATIAEDGFTDVVLLGMGGSSLAPEVLSRCFAASDGHPHLHVLDSTDAARILEVQRAVELERTLFIVSSKSGGTIEPLSLFAHFHALSPAGERFAAITDPGSGLAGLAEQHGFRHTFFGDPNIGGRYSALSDFGTVPAALMGVDVVALLSGAGAAWETEPGSWARQTGPDKRLASGSARR